MKEAASREPEVEIRLTTQPITESSRVRYSFLSGHYEAIPNHELAEDFLTLPSKTILKEELQRMEDEKKMIEKPKDESKSKAEEEDDFAGIISKEELKKLDSQPNPFNFSDRVTQTNRVTTKATSIQTDPPPSTHFSANASQSTIYDAYQKDFQQKVQKELQKELKKEKEKDKDSVQEKQESRVIPKESISEAHSLFGEDVVISEEDMKRLSVAARTLERMVSQNIYDEITQDFKYWEDASDEFHPLEGSLLPLWKFTHETSRNYLVSCVHWSPVYADLFAVSYRSDDLSGTDGEGMVCLFSIKNPSAPERSVKVSAGVTTVAFHPWIASVLCAGRMDGNVSVFDVRDSRNVLQISSSAVTGKHLMLVRQVHWLRTEPGEDLSFFSTSLDGRLTQWHIHCGTLIYTDLLDFSQQADMTNSNGFTGRGTCIAFRPDCENVFLLGSDTGAIFQCTTEAATHDLTKYDAHSAPVRDVKWNPFNNSIFLSCSIDWTIKLWVQDFQSPLVVLDVGGPVAGICWSPSSSTVLVAATDEGKVHVFDLFLRKCRPMCVQNVVQKRKLTLTAVDFSPYFPVIVVGGSRGYLVTLKLSPNLRKIHKDAKGVDEQRQKEVEMAKMERLIAISKAQIKGKIRS